MKKCITIFPLLLLVFCARVFAAESPWAELEERRRTVAAIMETATVWIVAEDDEDITYGTGFLVGDGYVATNAHVLADLKKNITIHVLNESIPERKATIVATVYDQGAREGVDGRDFALLRFDPPKNVALPVLVFNLDAKRMDRVSAWGYPGIATQFDVRTERLRQGDTSRLTAPAVIYTEGAINAVMRTGAVDVILHSAQIAGGNSGGPLVNGRGEVVGINTWGYKKEGEGAFLNGAQPARDLALFMMDNGLTPKLAADQTLTAPPKNWSAEDPGEDPQKQKTVEGQRRSAGDFSVLVPPKWSVVEEEDNYILLASDDGDTAVSILLAEREGKSIRRIALDLSEEFEGTKPEEDDGLFIFTYTEDEVDTVIFIGDVEDGENFVMISISGDMKTSEVSDILNSIEDR